ncbi:MAG: nitroreductase [Clostridiales bacterium]|nr:nitroreductase [Clostridiales bacterium]
MHETLNVIHSRRSHRAYKAAPLTREQLDVLIDAALQAPSAMNLQPWHLTAVEDQNLLDDISRACADYARGKAGMSPRFQDPSFHVFYHAPAVMFLSYDPTQHFAPFDCGIAVENMALAAESMGLGTVILGLPRMAFLGDQAQRLADALHFPQGYAFALALAVGTPDDDKAAHSVRDGLVTRLP